MTTRQRIDAMHETRMWIGQVIIPATVGLVTIDRINPMLKYQIKDGFVNCKNSIKSKFQKKGEA